MTINDVKKYYDNELKDVERLLGDNAPAWAKPKEVVTNSIQRCLGVAEFAQTVGLTYEEVTKCYIETRNKLENLLKETLDKKHTYSV